MSFISICCRCREYLEDLEAELYIEELRRIRENPAAVAMKAGMEARIEAMVKARMKNKMEAPKKMTMKAMGTKNLRVTTCNDADAEQGGVG